MFNKKLRAGQINPLSGWRSRLQLLSSACARMRSEASVRFLLIRTEISVRRKIAASRKRRRAEAEGRNDGGLGCQEKMTAFRARDIARRARSALIEKWRNGS